MEAAINTGNFEIVKYLLEMGANPNYRKCLDDGCSSIIDYSLAIGNIDIVEILLKYGLSKDILKNSITLCRDIKSVKLLMNNGIDIYSLFYENNFFEQLLHVNYVSCVIESGRESFDEFIAFLKYLCSIGIIFEYKSWKEIRRSFNNANMYLTPGFEDPLIVREYINKIQVLFDIIKCYFDKRGINISDESIYKYFDTTRLNTILLNYKEGK